METDRQTLKGTETEASTSVRRITWLQMSLLTITSNSLENVVVAILVLIIGCNGPVFKRFGMHRVLFRSQ